MNPPLRSALFVLHAAALAIGCTTHVDPPAEGAPFLMQFSVPDLPADGQHQVVAVVDTGFDLSLPIYAGKIAGGYTITCDPAPKQPTTFAEAKAMQLAAFATKDTRCRLVPGITLRKSLNLDAVIDQRSAWNAVVVAHGTPDGELARLGKVIEGEQTFDYHGTWTSALIAYDNPGVRMVFVQNPSQRRGDAPVTCPSAESLALSIALAQDSDLRAAYLASPPTALSDDLAAMFRHHGVTLENESFGPVPLRARQAACPSVATQLRTLAELEADLSGARQAAINATEYEGVALVNVRSAGNAAVMLNDMADDINCPTDSRDVPFGASSIDLMIGSWGVGSFGEPRESGFSNAGACVPFFAPGEHIVSESPDGFLALLNGTSFAAPLVVRHLSLMPVGTTPRAMRDTLVGMSLLPAEWFPAELVYDSATPGSAFAF